MMRCLGALIFTALALPAAPKVSRIEVQPATVQLMHLRDSAQLTVTAHLADGRVMDVTHEAKFTLSNPAVAGIEAALLRPKAVGATEVRVEYAGHRENVALVSEAKVRAVSFKHDTLPLLSKLGCSSGSCHGAPHGKGGFRLSLRAFDPALDKYTLTREELGRRTNPLHPAASLLLAKPSMAVAHEGGRRFRKGDEDYNLLRDWIAEGCQVQAGEPTCVKLTVSPDSGRVLKHPAWTQQLRVVARFADGTQRDVTRLAVFESSDDKVADIDRTGRVTGFRRGEAAVLVRYLEHIESVLITFVRDVDGFAWPDVPQKNYVDRHVDTKLRQLQFAPAGLCDDGTFVRRVHLDLIGTLPTIAETDAFVADPRPNKRAQLIDTLLNRPAHAKFWALKWGDLLRLSVKQIGAPSVHKYHRWIEGALAANMPYDRFATALLTARGSTLRNPPANFFRTAANRDDAVETSAQIFLGTRIACAKCHNHPFERWTQDNYYGMASFFNRIQRRRTGKGDETWILDAKSGEVTHPLNGRTMKPWAPVAGEMALSAEADRRREFARWLTSADNPFFARVEVNRLWAHVMGRGIVEPFDDFRDTNPPANAPLLDALAADFVKSGYDRRHILRVILNSRTYQAASSASALNRDDRKYFSHYRTRMLSAEQLLDAIGEVTGIPERLNGLPPDMKCTQVPAPELANVGFLKIFGQPERQSACECERSDESSLERALQLYNGRLLDRRLKDGNNRFRRALAAGKADAEVIDELYLAALSRRPSEAERKIITAHLAKSKDRNAAYENILWALLNKTEFLFQH
ncbi:MAG: hypothetical protein CMO66_02870 [Verrucomicrobiales bacterium]|nr:hypothetical protein [Verrucomicrobiales bacterium]